jgi:lipid-A-disaccharide synthase
MNIFILAGEPSGDEYGAKLMQELISINPNTNFSGIGGTLMEKQGLNSMAPFEKMSVMGFTEIIKNILFFIVLEKKILKQLKQNPPDKIVLIDYPGFNLRLCKKIKLHLNVKIIYYISPQIWAWKEKRIETIKKYIDQILVIFEFEKRWYADRKVNVNYVGHPFLDIWTADNHIESILSKYEIDDKKPILTLFPGSRNQEINKHLDLFINAALIVKQSIPELQILLGLHPDIKLNKKISDQIIIINDMPLKALEIATAAIVSSGTATLQSAIMNTPAVVVYKMNLVSWVLTKKLVQVKFASMANIIANKLVFPELLQNNATSNNISDYIIKLINNTIYRKKIMREMKLIKQKIGNSGASLKAAEFIDNI